MKLERLRPLCLGVLSLAAIAIAVPPVLGDGPVVTITTKPAAFAGLTGDDPFTLQMMPASGGGTTYSWSISSGSLPAGLTMSTGGLITGAPAQKATHTVTFRVVDDETQWVGSKTFTLSVYGVPKPKPIDIPYTLSAIYMPKPSWPSHQWADLRFQNERNEIKAPGIQGQRMPLLGFYQGDSPEVLDWQTKMAVDRGITNFSFHDYWIENVDRPTYETGIEAFLHARYRDRMSFGVVFNYCRTAAGTAAALRACFLDTAVPFYVAHYFNQPNYFQIDGKPVIQILSLYAAFGSSTANEIKALKQETDAYITQHSSFGGAYWVTVDIADSSPNYTFANPVALGLHAVATGSTLPHLWPAAVSFPIPRPTVGTLGNEVWLPGVSYGPAVETAIQMQTRNFEQAAVSGLKYIASVAPDFTTTSRRPTSTSPARPVRCTAASCQRPALWPTPIRRRCP